jgi:hypothetical protein
LVGDLLERWPTLHELQKAKPTTLRRFLTQHNCRVQEKIDQRALNKAHHPAVRALAFKWIRILFRCWQNRTPYDETIYLNALRRRQPPLIAPPQPIVDLQLKKPSGFWKITAADT